MKCLTLLIFVLSSQSLYCQRIERLADSLSLKGQRSWIDINGSEFTDIGDNCDRGIEMTFYDETETMDLFICHEGEWKKWNYHYQIIIENQEHIIQLFKWENRFLFFKRKAHAEEFLIEVQMISADQRDFRTVINFFWLESKDTYTLTSK